MLRALLTYLICWPGVEAAPGPVKVDEGQIRELLPTVACKHVSTSIEELLLDLHHV